MANHHGLHVEFAEPVGEFKGRALSIIGDQDCSGRG